MIFHFFDTSSFLSVASCRTGTERVLILVISTYGLSASALFRRRKKPRTVTVLQDIAEQDNNHKV